MTGWRCLFPQGEALAGSYVFFVATAFLLYPVNLWTMTFYLGIVPVFGYQFYRHGGGTVLKTLWQIPCFRLVLALLGWTALTLLWGESPSTHRSAHYFMSSVTTLIFISGLLLALTQSPNLPRRLGTALIWAGTLNAVLAIVTMPLWTYNGSRFGGFLITSHPILGAMVISLCYLFALQRVMNEPAHRYRYAAAAIVLLMFIAMTQSRGPYIAVAVSTVVLLLRASGQNKLRIGAVLAVTVGALFLGAWLVLGVGPLGVFHLLAERGTSYRFEIWQFSWHRILERPWFGHGSAAYLGMAEFTFPHNIFLSALFYYGLVGFGLFMLLLGRVFYWLLRHWRQHPDAPLLLAILTCTLLGGMTDLSQLAKAPGELWMMLWLPLGLVLAAMAQAERSR